MRCDSRKVGIVGLGNVGLTVAYALLLSNLVDELVLVSRSMDKAVGEKLDLEHGLPFLESAEITATDNYAALANSDVIIITAGVGQQPGQTRLDLVNQNKKIISEMIPKLAPHVHNSTILVVSNPVDVLTYQIAQMLNLPKGRVFGSGTMLDTARFRFHLSEFLNVGARSIHAYVLGEHGDSSFPALSEATIGGQKLASFPNYSDDKATAAYQKTKTAAYQIIKSKGATFYAIGVVIAHLVRTILHDKRTVLPVSVPIEDYYGQSSVAISVPCIVGRNGVEQILHVSLSETEKEQFINSCEVIRQFTV